MQRWPSVTEAKQRRDSGNHGVFSVVGVFPTKVPKILWDFAYLCWANPDLSGTSWGSALSTRRRFSLQFDLIVINGGSDEIF